MILETNIPSILNANNLQSLKLTPEDVFVLSRVNGMLTVKQIVQIVGFPFEKVTATLQKLLDQNVIQMKAEESKQKTVVSDGPKTIIQTLDEEDRDPVLSQIPRVFRNRIQLLFQGLAKMNFFEVLEVSPSTSSEEVHASYLKLVKEFHPDRLRGKEPGHYKQKLEKIFEKIQEAYQSIHADGQRAAYLHSLMEARRSGKDLPDKKPKYEYKVPRKNAELHFADADSQYEMGIKEEKRGNLQAAMNFYQMAVSLNPQRKVFEEAFQRVRKLMREGF